MHAPLTVRILSDSWAQPIYPNHQEIFYYASYRLVRPISVATPIKYTPTCFTLCAQPSIFKSNDQQKVYCSSRCCTGRSTENADIVCIEGSSSLTLAAKRRRRVTAIVWRFLSVRPSVCPSIRLFVRPYGKGRLRESTHPSIKEEWLR